MTKAKLNTQHDYVTLSVTFDGGLRINLTTARYSEKCSAKVGYDPTAMKRTFNAFAKTRSHVTKGGKFETIGQWMDHMRAVAEGATDPLHLATLFEAEVPSAPQMAAAKAEEKKAHDDLMAQLKSYEDKKPTLVEVPVPTKAELIASSKTPTQEELQAAFDKVKNQKNWKARIDRTINIEDLSITLHAIAHFHGSIPYEVPHPTKGKVIVRSKGYAC